MNLYKCCTARCKTYDGGYFVKRALYETILDKLIKSQHEMLG